MYSKELTGVRAELAKSLATEKEVVWLRASQLSLQARLDAAQDDGQQLGEMQLRVAELEVC